MAARRLRGQDGTDLVSAPDGPIRTFEISVRSRQSDGWPVVVTRTAGNTSLPVRTDGMLQLDPTDLLPLALDPRGYGTHLGKTLFGAGVRDAFAAARGAMDEADVLHVLLTIEDPVLRILRWERLCAPVGDRWRYLARDQRLPFSLYLPSPSDIRFRPFGRRDLRALIVVANPEDLARYGLAPFDAARGIASVTAALGEILRMCSRLVRPTRGHRPSMRSQSASPPSATPCCISFATAG